MGKLKELYYEWKTEHAFPFELTGDPAEEQDFFWQWFRSQAGQAHFALSVRKTPNGVHTGGVSRVHSGQTPTASFKVGRTGPSPELPPKRQRDTNHHRKGTQTKVGNKGRSSGLSASIGEHIRTGTLRTRRTKKD